MRDGSKLQTEIDFLSALEEGDVVTQMTLSKRISVSVGLINALLKRAMHKGYVKAKAAPYKRYAYYVTPQGFSEKSRLVAEYLDTSLTFFRTARQQYAEIFLRAEVCGLHRIALVGGGELAEIAILAALEMDGVEVVLVFDRATNKERLHGVAVARTPEELADVDGLVITDTRAPQAAYDWAREQCPQAEVLAPPLLRVADRPPEFGAKVRQR